MAEEQVTQQATEQTTETAEDVSRETSDVPEVLAERPEFVPEKFWNEETGEVKLDDLAKSYTNLESFLSGKKDEMREQLLAKLQLQAKESMKIQISMNYLH